MIIYCIYTVAFRFFPLLSVTLFFSLLVHYYLFFCCFSLISMFSSFRLIFSLNLFFSSTVFFPFMPSLYKKKNQEQSHCSNLNFKSNFLPSLKLCVRLRRTIIIRRRQANKGKSYKWMFYPNICWHHTHSQANTHK